MTATAVIASIWMIVATGAVAAGGQDTPVAARPVFEVASVKPNPADHARGSMGVRPGGRFEAVNATPFLLVTFAYDVGADFIEGAPDQPSPDGAFAVGRPVRPDGP